MRRPSGPAQRTPPQPSAPVTRESGARDEPARPIDLRERRDALAQSPTPAESTRGDSSKRDEQARADAGAGRAGDAKPASAFSTWREMRRAIAARRRVERSEARRFTARTRRRRQLQLGIAAFVFVVLCGAVISAYSPMMALRHIEVVGTHSVKAADVQRALSGELGTPLPLVKSSDVRHALDDFRLIESYSTQLEPPSTLVVRITERTPLGVVKQGSTYEVVDQAGVALSASSTAPAGLPTITVPSGQRPEDSPGFAAAASVIASLPTAVRSTVTGASATSANNVTLVLRGGKHVVWGGTGQMELKAADLQALLKGAPHASVYDVSSPRAPITR
ncbi:hypothetical protein GCM10022286_01830 [Gryllotalpicola daejeonensis]|uniref:POTRA domain-containing protein n=1 Tax=Gryllotalpicola daejeonensis TaxID=993087 RepID=A0ABP7ZDH3_9MICO